MVKLSIPASLRGQLAWLWLLLLLPGCGPDRPRARPGSAARVAPADAPPAPGLIRLTILSTNDLHGQLEPLRRFTAEPTPRPYRIGGAEALAATIAELRAADPDGTLLLDAGDFMQGSLLANHHEGAPVRELFGLLRYDAAVIGNHEFDYGPVGVPDPPPGHALDPRGALRAFCAAAPFPILSANLRQADGSDLGWKGLQRSLLLHRRGVPIGLIGLTTPQTAVTTMPAHVEGLRFEPWLPVVKREASALRRAGARLIVVMAHGVGECHLSDPASCRGELFELLDQLQPGLVDVVIAGHSHQPIAHRYRGVLVSEACSRGQVIGRVELLLDSRGRLLPESRVLTPLPVCHDIFAGPGDCREGQGELGPLKENPWLHKHRGLLRTVRQTLARYRGGSAVSAGRVLAQATRPLLHHRSALSEVGTLFARALLASTAGADAAIFNGGSVRADLPAGPLRFVDLYEAFPFDNRVATVRLNREQLAELITHLLQHSHGVPVLAGLRLRLSCDQPRRLLALQDDKGHPLQPRRLYTLVLSDFLLTGGDGLAPLLGRIPAARKRILGDRLIRDAIAGYLERQRTPLNSQSDPVVAPGAPPVTFVDGPCPDRSAAPGFCR